jgi:hypothetical protein
MLSKVITYTDYEGNERKEEFHFNLSKAELMKMEMGTTGGMKRLLDRIVEAQDTKRIIEIFEDIILRSYGEKSLDGKHFEKYRDGKRLADSFASTEAFSELFMELATDDKAAAAFINGIIPQSLAEEIAKNPQLTPGT